MRAGVAASLVLLGMASGAAWATPGVTPPPPAFRAGEPDPGAPAAQSPLDGLLRDLNDDAFAVRERASALIAGDLSVPLDEIARALARPDLSPEQSARLAAAGEARFVNAPHAALGTSFQASFGTSPQVVIGRPQPGWDAARVLQPGDVIRAADGVVIDDFEQFRAILTAHDPGEAMALNILRGGRSIEVRVTLGRYDDLRDPLPLDEDLLRGAWAHRVARVWKRAGLSPEQPAIDPRIDARTWRQLSRATERGERSMAGQAVAGSPEAAARAGPRLVAGGTARATRAWAIGPDGGRQGSFGGGGRGWNAGNRRGEPDLRDPIGPFRAQLEARRAQRVRELNEALAVQERLREALRQAATDEERAAARASLIQADLLVQQVRLLLAAEDRQLEMLPR